MGAPDGQAVSLRKGGDRLIILFGRPEAGGKFFRRQVMPKIGMGRIGEFLQ